MVSKQIKIRFDKIDDVKNFVEIASKIPNIIDVLSGRHIADAKSIMGLFSLDLSKNLVLTIYGDLNPAFEYELRKFEVLE